MGFVGVITRISENQKPHYPSLSILHMYQLVLLISKFKLKLTWTSEMCYMLSSLFSCKALKNFISYKSTNGIFAFRKHLENH
jgi:hypothetical protein